MFQIIHIIRVVFGILSLLENLGIYRIGNIRTKKVIVDFFTAGALIIMAFYQLALFCLNHREKKHLFFAIFILLISVRIFTSGELLLFDLFPSLSWSPLIDVAYLSAVVPVPIFISFLDRIYPNCKIKNTTLIFSIFAILLSMMIIILPLSIYTKFIPIIQLNLFSGCVFSLIIIIRAISKKEKSTVLFLAGMIVLKITVLNDILHNLRLINSEYYAQYGLLIFVLFQSTVLAFERRESEKLLKTRLMEKNILIKEIFHRAKNNMQVISGMINLSINDPGLRPADLLNNLDSRIKAMALVHKMLYQTDNFNRMCLSSFINELVSSISSAYSNSSIVVNCNINCRDILILLDEAVPLGLILNELLTNSYKHAFDAKKVGEISIEVKKKSEKELLLHYSDNGVGLPEGFDYDNTKTLGIYMLKLLVEHQLDGKVKISEMQGLKYEIELSVNNYTERVKI